MKVKGDKPKLVQRRRDGAVGTVPLSVVGKEKERLLLEKELLELRAKNRQYEETHRTEFFKPFDHQQRGIDFIREGKKTVIIVGANQIGKTVLGANIADAFSNGCKTAWDGANLFPSVAAMESGGRKVLGRILCNDWEKAARDTIVPKLKEWLPLGTYETKKNNVGVDYEFTFPKSGSRITILTYKEDTKSHEGWTGDWVLADEPPPRDKYIANRRGLIARNGTFIMTMTAISEPWILDELVLQPDVTTGIVADIPIEANTTLSEEAIRIFAASLTEDEKVARLKGGWLQLTGRVWKVFDVNRNTCEPFKIPPDWPCQFQIDFHLNLPHAIIFYGIDKYGRKFYFNEVWQNMGTEEIADEIIRVKQARQLRMTYGEIDALSKGDTAYIRNRYGQAEDSFTIIEKKLRKYGIRLGVGSKDEKSYITAVEEQLKGPNGEPLIKIFNDCKETIKQVSRWAYDEHGKPKSDGHFPECIGRSTQTGLKYSDPAQFSRPLKLAECPV